MRSLSVWQRLEVAILWRVRHLIGIHTPVFTVSVETDEHHTVRSIRRRWECGICGIVMGGGGRT